MKYWLRMSGVVGISILFLSACSAGGSSDSPRKTVEDAFQAVQTGLNSRNISMADPFFATTAEGANTAGLQETRGALDTFAASLSGSDQVQFHDFAIQNVKVQDSDGLAKVTYKLHLSVVRSGTQLAFGATVTQDLALLKTPRGWRISGGDQPQLSEVKGQLSAP